MSGWARHDGDEEVHIRGPFSAPIVARPDTLIIDMPVGRPVMPAKPDIKGVARPTTEAEDEDHMPGEGTWSEHLGNHYGR